MGFGTLVVPLGTVLAIWAQIAMGKQRCLWEYAGWSISGRLVAPKEGCPLNRVDPEWTLNLWTLSRQLGKTCSEIGIPLYARLIGVREVKNGSRKCFGELHWHLNSVNQKIIQG